VNKAHTEKLRRDYLKSHPLANPLRAEEMGNKEPENLDEFTAEDWKQYLHSQKLVAARALVREIQNGKVTANEAFWKLLGEFIEKTEHKVELGLSADEIARRNFEADRQLRDGGYRVEEVSEKPPLLSEQVCVDNKQEHSPDS